MEFIRFHHEAIERQLLCVHVDFEDMRWVLQFLESEHYASALLSAVSL